uniref:GOLD domain-containing protein n=1 Tax=Arcella intermedia TaxID=1963864 RepID=A0A6B2LJV7_9EUKA
MQFDVHPGEKRCLFEDFTEGQVIQGTYKVPQVNSMQMSIKIVSPSKDEPIWQIADASEGSYAFIADVDGIYKFCFTDKSRPNSKAKQVTRRITFTAKETWEKLEDKDTVEKSELKPLEFYLASIERNINFLKREVREHRLREKRNQETTEYASTMLPTFSTFTIVMLVVCGIIQVLYLRNYFRKKKLV